MVRLHGCQVRARSRLGALVPSAVVATVAVVAVVGWSGPPETPAAARSIESRPNVVVIETDDQTVESMKVMRNAKALIGAQGATFQNSFVNYSLCCPSRATFLTGEYAHNHGVWSNDPPDGGFRRFESLHAHNNLAVWLQHAGYFTAMIGKYLNNYRNQPPVPPGWSEWHAAAPRDQDVYDYPINNDGILTQHGQAPSDFKQDVLTKTAAELVDRRAPQAQPFFLWLTYTAPHISEPDRSPLPPFDCADAAQPAPRDAHAFDDARLPEPPNFNEADVSDKPGAIRDRPRLNARQIAAIQRSYRCERESLLSVDDGVARVIHALQASGELNKTLVIFTSDNGYYHGEHRIPAYKGGIYEESIRVPLLMRGPGIPKGARISPLAVNADLAPTIVDAANARAGRPMDGRSLLPVVKQPAMDQDRLLLIEEPSVRAIRTERYVFAEHASGVKELYDLQIDPYELRNVYKNRAYAPVRAELASRLHKLQSCAGPSCRVYGPVPSP